MHAIVLLLLSPTVSDPVELGSFKATPPAEWKVTRPTNQMQYRVFTLPKAEGDKDETVLTIFSFPGSVGSLESNLSRWKGMIEPDGGKKVDDVAKIEKLKVGDIEVTTFDAAGTYLFKPNLADASNVIRKPDYRLINVFFPTADRVFTMRLVGPAKSVAAAEKGFKEWLKSFK
jgi:hypothetical protein